MIRLGQALRMGSWSGLVSTRLYLERLRAHPSCTEFSIGAKIILIYVSWRVMAVKMNVSL